MKICINYPADKLQHTDAVADILGLSRSAFIAMCVSYYITTVINPGGTAGQSKNGTCVNC